MEKIERTNGTETPARRRAASRPKMKPPQTSSEQRPETSDKTVQTEQTVLRREEAVQRQQPQTRPYTEQPQARSDAEQPQRRQVQALSGAEQPQRQRTQERPYTEQPQRQQPQTRPNAEQQQRQRTQANKPQPQSNSQANRAPSARGASARTTSRTTRSGREKHLTAKTVIGRIFIVILAALLFFVGSVFALCSTIAHGPSTTIRNMLVLSAKQASATKWVPELFLPKEVVEEILALSKVITVDEIDIDDYGKDSADTQPGGDPVPVADEWEGYPDGIRLEMISGSTYKAYLLIVKDPSRVIVGISGNYGTAKYGERIFTIVQKYNAVAAINGGEFPDDGTGTGATPTGLTYSEGECVWNDGAKRTFMGFDSDNKLIVTEEMTKTEADELGIRDAVSFQRNNVLITNSDGKVKLFYTDGDNGTAQRTAIGQRADGAVLLLVTDGRSASSLGATHNDVIDIMVSYGAVTAGMLDGGSSSMMYYEKYWEKYDVDESTLDEYQRQGLVNKYKAFTRPRRIPTYFVVK